MRQLYFISFMALLMIQLAFSGQAFAQEPVIDTQFTVIKKEHFYQGVYDATYRVKLINGDRAIKKVSATVTSNTDNIEVIDGNVAFNDTPAGGTADSVDTITIRLLHKYKFDPATHLAWKINYELVEHIKIETSPGNQVFNLSESHNIATNLNFIPPVKGTPYTVNITQTISPATGLSASPAVNGASYNLSANFGTVLAQVLTPSAVGEYTITTTATIAQTSQSSTSTAKVRVGLGIESEITVPQPGSYPDALAVNSTTPVLFTASVTGKGVKKVSAVFIRDLDSSATYPLFDNGQNGDLHAGDFDYEGTFTLTTTGMSSGTCIRFAAVAVVNNVETQSSKTEKLCVTKYPIGLKAITKNEIEQNGFSTVIGPTVSKDIINITVAENTTEAQIDAIVTSVGGIVIGANPHFGNYQIKLLTPPSSLFELVSLLHSIESNPNVVGADLTYVIDMLSSLTPTDTRFGEQDHLTKIRADEAWYIGRGNDKVIAVVDTGVDLEHPDLAGKIINGKDFVDGDLWPDDLQGHGTHVAGIAAAATDNNEGIAGVAWGSEILAVRVFDEHGSPAYDNAIADGITYAAGQRAKIINISAGFTASASSAGLFCILKEQLGLLPEGTCKEEVMDAIQNVCRAVDAATSKGKIVVASAGNSLFGGTTQKFYPAGCSTAIAVGATTASDARAYFSHYGPWVDIAAPGENILSTYPVDSGSYETKTGTSQASPIVAGAAAVVWSRSPELTAAEVEERLKKTAKKLPDEQLGAGRVDLFEAVFDGSFEEGELSFWENNGTVSSIDSLNALLPQDRDRMGYASTGPSGTQTSGSLSQVFQVQEGVTTLPITFKYAFISEEFPEWVGSEFDDSLEIKLKAPDGSITTLASESINSSSYSAISSLDFPGGDSTVGWTGWKTVTKDIPITSGEGEYEILLEDAGDAIYDTVLLIDHIQFK